MTNKINALFASFMLALTMTMFLPSASQAMETCSECDGKITTLTLKYNGEADARIEAYGSKGEVLFSGMVSQAETFTLLGFDRQGTLGTQVSIYVGGQEATSIHTSCSVSIAIGMDFGAFTLVDGYSRNGGKLCMIEGYVPTGNVCGTVYEDVNENGSQDDGEIGVAGIEVNIVDANTETRTVTTDDQGFYCAKYVVEGEATVTVVETTLPKDVTDANLTAGVNPNDITVLANQNNPAGADGYTFPTPTGNVCGTVYADENRNNIQDDGEIGMAGIEVQITDADGETITVLTDDLGNYCAKDIIEGEATVTVVETTLPECATLTAGVNPSLVTILPNEDNPAGTDGYTCPIPTGNVCGTVYADSNRNGTQNDGEIGIAGIQVEIVDADGYTVTVTTDAQGNYCAKDIIEGTATVTVVETTLPECATLTAGVNPNDVTVIADQDNPAGTDGYTCPIPTGNVCGVVYKDANRNGTQDNSEVGIAGIQVEITDANGDTVTVTTNDLGNYCAKDIIEGEATVTVVETTLPDCATLTAGVNPSDVTVIASQDNPAGTDGYTCPVPTGNVCGTVYADENRNETQDNGEIGIAGIQVQITDANGDTVTVTTNDLGNYCAKDIVEGTATVTVVETTLPDCATLTAGMNPSDVTVLADQDNPAGTDGYTCPLPVECNPCDGKITSLTLRYNATEAADVEAYTKKVSLFSGTIDGESLLTLDGYDRQGTLGAEISLDVNSVFDTSIHTSCSVEIAIGMDFGSFTIVDGYSRNGGKLCPVE